MFMSMRTAVAVRRVTSSTDRRAPRRGLSAWAAALGLAVVDALEQTRVTFNAVKGAIEGKSVSVCFVPVLLVEAELGLDGGAVDAEAMETLSGPTSQLHVLLPTVRIDGEGNLDMHAGDELRVRELPDVDVMAGNNTGECLDILANLGDADMLRGSLEKDPCGAASEGNASLENDGGNEQGDGGIGIHLSRPVGKPDDQSGSHDTNVAEHIADDVKNHGVHTHVVVTVAVAALLARLLRQCMVVAVVNTRISASSGGVGVRVSTRLDQSRLRGITKRADIPRDTLEKRRFLVRLLLGHKRGL